MKSIKGIYDGKILRLSEKIKVTSPKEVIITFLDDVDLGSLHALAEAGGSFDFLDNESDDIYSDNDLKVKYK